MRHSRALSALATAAAAVVALAGCSAGSGSPAPASTSGTPTTTIRMALNNTSDSVPIIVAQKQGFFADNHLNVTTTTLADITVVPSLLGNQYDVGFTVAPILIRAASAGVKAVMISGNDGDSDTFKGVQIIVRDGINSIADLKGKRMGSPTLQGNLNIATKAWLSKNGVDPSSMQFVQVPTPNMADQLKAGQIDAAEMIYPFITTAKAEGLRSLGDPQRALTPDYLGGTYWAASEPWAKANPKAVEGFRAALKSADEWIAKNKAKAYQVVADYTKVPVAQAKTTPLPLYTTMVTPADLKIWGDAMKKFGGFTGTIDYSSLVYTGK